MIQVKAPAIEEDEQGNKKTWNCPSYEELSCDVLK